LLVDCWHEIGTPLALGPISGADVYESPSAA